MKSDTTLDFAVFQLSPRRSRCELFVSGDGKTEKLASGLLKPFVTHLKVAEEQVAQAVQSIKLEVEKHKNVGKWFTKGTLERFVRFVSTPEVLELVNTFDSEMSQLEAARRIYSQGAGDQLSGVPGENEKAAATTDVTKKELLRAIDVRLVAVKQDLTAACARASAAGFTLDSVSELRLFADRFGAHRLNEACSKFILLCQRRPELINPWKGIDDRAVRSSSGSDMSLDEPTEEMVSLKSSRPLQQPYHSQQQIQEQDIGHPSDQSKAATGRLKLSTSASFQARHSLRDPSNKDEGGDSEGVLKKDTENTTDSSRSLSTQQPSRRLSVQDRINMFENKQKEQSGNASSGSKTIVGGKVAEPRRLSSDVSSSSAIGPTVLEKAVLRRWSGASDMSVDSSSDRKESNHCENTTVPSSLKSHSNKDDDSLKDTATSQSGSGLKEDRDALQNAQLRAIPGRAVGNTGTKEQAGSQTKLGDLSVGADDMELKDQKISEIQTRSFSGRAEDASLKDQATIQTKSKTYLGGEHVGPKDQGSPQAQFGAYLGIPEHDGSKDHVSSQRHVRAFSGSAEDSSLKDSTPQVQFRALTSQADAGVKDPEAPQILSRAFPSRVEDVELKDQPASLMQVRRSKSKDPTGLQSQLKAFREKAEDIVKDPMDSQAQFKGFDGKAEDMGKSDQLTSQSHWRSFPGKMDELGKKDFNSEMQLAASYPSKVEEPGVKDSGIQGVKLRRQISAPERNRRFQYKRDQNTSISGNGEPSFTWRKGTETPETFDLDSNTVVEPVQKVRQSKGNQELNDELQMKANELEKLFAAHKLRLPGDQMGSARRSKTADVQQEQLMSVVEKKLMEAISTESSESQVREQSGSLSDRLEFDVNSVMKIVDNQDVGNSLNQKLANIGSSEDSRGKFYGKYMQKRDAKLREESVSKRAQKDAKMKAMHDSLERSKAEMKAKLSGSADRRDSALLARRRAEKLKSFNVHVAAENKERQLEEPFQSEEEDDPPELPDETCYGQDTSFSETLSGDASSRSVHSKKLSYNKSLSSTTPRTMAAPIPRSSLKVNNPGSGRRRPENLLAQSVPNFSDLRKENTKPSTVISKTGNRPLLRNYARSRSTNEELSLVKEEKPRRSQSMRKSSASPAELEDPACNSDSIVLTPLKFSKESTEQNIYNKFPKDGESKPFLRKGNGVGPGAGARIAKLKASIESDNLKDGEESEELIGQPEDSHDMVKEDDEEEEYERMSGEEAFKDGDFPAESDNEKLRLSQELEKYGDPGSENGEVLRSLSQVDDNSAAALVSNSSKFNTSVGTAQDSPGESPGSWNSRVCNPFSYTQDASDVDASADSPIGSPASWNSHSLNPMMDADAARMRKKWGSAQKPILVANTSHQSRKDVTKGFKRLLKFGRKSKGSESLITDWVSASTTSEGDDDTEDGRDPTNRSSEDLRKTRMGFSQDHPSYDGFIEGEIFNEQVQSLYSSIPAPPANFKLREDHISGSSLKAPRSFFSLSSFRSKGSDSKPR